MLVRKLRLQKAWSQEQLAELSGLSVRTIQRIERGQEPSLESIKSLAAVFEVSSTDLQQGKDMTHIEQKPSNIESQLNSSITEDEEKAIQQVKDLKDFYSHLIQFAVTISILFAINYFVSPEYIWTWWVVLGWGIGIISHAFYVFEVVTLFGASWEKRQVEKRLNRKL